MENNEQSFYCTLTKPREDCFFITLHDGVGADIVVSGEKFNWFCNPCQKRHIRRFEGIYSSTSLRKKIYKFPRKYSYSFENWTSLFRDYLPPLNHIVGENEEKIVILLEDLFVHQFRWRYKNPKEQEHDYISCQKDSAELRRISILPIYIVGKRVSEWPKEKNVMFFIDTSLCRIFVGWIHKKELIFYKLHPRKVVVVETKNFFNFDKEYDVVPNFINMHGSKYKKITEKHKEPKLSNVIDISSAYDKILKKTL